MGILSLWQHGESGQWVSEIFPEVAKMVDDLCLVKSLHGSNPAHGAALMKIHTGSDTFVRPSMGSWITYGLGSENENLPGFVTICPTLGHGGVVNWSSAFLPAAHHGVPMGNAAIPAARAQFAHGRRDAGTPAGPTGLPASGRTRTTEAVVDPRIQGRIESFNWSNAI